MRGPLALVVVLALAVPVPARAACPLPPGALPALGQIDDGARLDAITARLRRTAHRSRIWRWSWLAIFAGAGAAQLALVPLAKNHGQRVDLYTGAVKAFGATLPLIVLPPLVIDDAAEVPIASPDRCLQLADAEHRLRRDAARERMGHGWLVHAVGLVYNAAFTLFLGLKYHHWGVAALGAGSGLVVGELQIYTTPDDDVGALDRYRLGVGFAF